MIDDGYNYEETNGFHSVTEKLKRDHERMDNMIHKDIEWDKDQESEISANTKWNAEQEIRISANTEMNEQQEIKIAQEISDRKADVDEEQGRATSAETTLNEKIEEEIARAISAETYLNQKIDAESSRAISAETYLDVRLSNEISRATSAETEIKTMHQGDIELLNKTIQHISSTVANVQSLATLWDSKLTYFQDQVEDYEIKTNAEISSMNDDINTSATKTQLDALEARVRALEGKI